MPSYFKFIIPSIILIVLSFTGCNKGISEKKFIQIYADIVIAQDTLGTDPATMNKIREDVLKKYEVGDAEYKITLDSYNKDPQKWQDFFDKVIKYLGEQRAVLKHS